MAAGIGIRAGAAGGTPWLADVAPAWRDLRRCPARRWAPATTGWNRQPAHRSPAAGGEGASRRTDGMAGAPTRRNSRLGAWSVP